MEEKLVSIVVPAYNHEKYILSCLESIKSQSYGNIELLVGDDRSTDNTYEIAGSWAESNGDRFSRIEVIENETNLGIVKNFNNLLKQCKGDYIKTIASDDMLIKDCIEKLVGYMEANPQYDLVFSNGYSVKEDARYLPAEEHVLGKIYAKPIDTSGDFFGRLYMYNRIAAPTVLYRRETFEKFGYYCEDLAYEDWEYWLRVARTGKIGYFDYCTVYYRMAENSASHFGSDEAGKRRLRKFYKEEEKILDMYSQYTNCTTDYFWCSVFLRAYKCKDFELIFSLMKERKITVFKLMRGVIQKLKGYFKKVK